MATTNTRNDMVKEAYEMSVGTYKYRTDLSYIPNDGTDHVISEPGIYKDYSKVRDMDIDSKLRGLDRTLTRYPTLSPSSSGKKNPLVSNVDTHALSPHVRFRNNQREQAREWDLWSNEFMLHQPQCPDNIMRSEEQRGGLNTRMNAKDQCKDTLAVTL